MDGQKKGRSQMNNVFTNSNINVFIDGSFFVEAVASPQLQSMTKVTVPEHLSKTEFMHNFGREKK
jgi:hypothetical protein